jgi:hypothetical protein
MEMRIGFRSILTAALLVSAAPAYATSTCIPPTCFFGEDIGAFPVDPFTNSNQAQADFLAMLDHPGTENFNAFDYPKTASLNLSFQSSLGTEIAAGTLNDPTGEGFIATAAIAKTGFPIPSPIPIPSPSQSPSYWKNETEGDAGLFSVEFPSNDPMRAFGFYATGYSTLSGAGGTQLALELVLETGATVTFMIPHSTDSALGNVFYFGVITDPFVKATLRNQGDDDGDVIGFDNFTVARNVVPEPASGALLAGGLLALTASRRRR